MSAQALKRHKGATIWPQGRIRLCFRDQRGLIPGGICKMHRPSINPIVIRRGTWLLAAAALAAMAQASNAQGIVRGAQEGAYQGNRVAGPVGGVVGGAVGAGVGGAVGAVEGALGVQHRTFRHHYRCRGYYDSYGYYRCFN
jgi:hypothetical protein